MKPNTVRLALAPVKAMLATAVEEGLIRSNPAAGLRIAQVNGNGGDELEDEKVKALTEDELRRAARGGAGRVAAARDAARAGGAAGVGGAAAAVGRRRLRPSPVAGAAEPEPRPDRAAEDAAWSP